MHSLYTFLFDYIFRAHAHSLHTSSVSHALASHARDVQTPLRTSGLSGRISQGPRANPDSDTAHQHVVPTQPLRPYRPRPQRAPTCPAHPRAHPHCCGHDGLAGCDNRSFGGSKAELRRCGHSPRDGVHGTQERRSRTPQPPERLFTLAQRERRPTRTREPYLSGQGEPYLSGQGGPRGVVASR